MTLNGPQAGVIALGSAVIAGTLVATGFLLGSHNGSSGQMTAVLKPSASGSVRTSAPTPSHSPAAKPKPSPPALKPSPAKPQPPDWSKIRYAMNCGGTGVVVVQALNKDYSGDGRPEAVRLVRCNAGAGSPPSSLFVYNADKFGAPHLIDTLISQGEGLAMNGISSEGNDLFGTVYAVDGSGIEYNVAWVWQGKGFVGVATS